MKCRPPFQLPSLRSERGAGLVTVLVTGLIVGAIIAGLNIYLDNRVRQRTLESLMDARNSLYENVATMASSPDSIFVSSLQPGNQELRKCVDPNFGICATRNAASAKTIRMYTPFSRKLSAVPISSLGPGDKAGRYTLRGLRSPCTPGPDCPFYAETKFWAQCSSINSCNEAVKIFVQTKIKTYNVNFAGDLKLTGYPTPAQLSVNPLYGVRELWVRDVRGLAIQECPAGSYMVGVNDKGTIICKCDQGFRQRVSGGQLVADSATGWPVCDAIVRCGPGEILVGTTKNGDAFCRTPPTLDYICEDRKTPSTGKVSCRPGWRMRAVHTSNPNDPNKQDCEVRNDKVHCDYMLIKCCRRK